MSKFSIRLINIGWIIIALGISISLCYSIYISPNRGETFLEALKILISWPFAVLLLGFSFGFVFKKEISRFLNNIWSIRFPGGAEIQTAQQEESSITEVDESLIPNQF